MKQISKISTHGYVYKDTKTDFSLLQSYDVIIAEKRGIVIYLDEKYYDYSISTVRDRNKFLGESSKEIKRKIYIGEYKLINLN